MGACITADTVNEAFLASPPLIAQQILDLTIEHPSWMRDLWELAEWPRGEGATMEQLVFRGSMPQIERGFDRWKKINNVSGCEPCDGPDCSYNWSQFGGHAFDRKLTELMEREFRSPEYCVAKIQTTANFKEVFAKIVENLYRQTDYFKEMNIGHNFLTSLAKKFVVDSQGARANRADPYSYRNIGTARLSTLNINMLEFFYESLRRLPDAVPYDVVDGSPIYSLLASHQMLARLYRDDAQLREDVRFSGMANDSLMKYNFMSTIRGMFIAAPILYPRRFNIVTGEAVEVLPFVDGIPAEVGTYTYLSPAYESATHEEVIIHGKHPFKIFYMPTEESLGEGTSFGPEFSFMNNWMWVNPLTDCDPFRRNGFFATGAKIGLSQQFSEGIYAILVERPSTSLMAMYTPNPVCPVAPPVCNNSVPDTSCPCPAVLDIEEDPFVVNQYIFTFATPVTGVVGDPVVLELDNGASVTGVLVQISADGTKASLLFASGLQGGSCANIVGVFCANNLSCSATVDYASDCRAGVDNNFDVILSNAIRALTAGQVITGYFGDCQTRSLEVVSVNAAALTWTLRYVAGTPTAEDILCNTKGLIKVCVPPSTDAVCPPCEQTTTVCSGTLV